MRSGILPSEHVVALFVNAVVISMALSSMFLLIPRFLQQSAKLSLIDGELQDARTTLGALEAQGLQLRAVPQVTAREQANLVPMSRVSIFWRKGG